jgi:hypothetical protein
MEGAEKVRLTFDSSDLQSHCETFNFRRQKLPEAEGTERRECERQEHVIAYASLRSKAASQDLEQQILLLNRTH